MSTHTNFVIFGTGNIGSFVVDELLKLKENGAISTVKIASRSVSLTVIHPRRRSPQLTFPRIP
jgi:saccharopine dehydrogenase-like NADP-dependent oxidoreductase